MLKFRSDLRFRTGSGVGRQDLWGYGAASFMRFCHFICNISFENSELVPTDSSGWTSCCLRMPRIFAETEYQLWLHRFILHFLR